MFKSFSILSFLEVVTFLFKIVEFISAQISVSKCNCPETFGSEFVMDNIVQDAVELFFI